MLNSLLFVMLVLVTFWLVSSLREWSGEFDVGVDEFIAV